MGAKIYSGGYRLTLRAEASYEGLMSIYTDVYIDVFLYPMLTKIQISSFPHHLHPSRELVRR